MVLKTIHDAIQSRENRRGSRIEESINGMAGIRKRASWWGMIDRTRIPNIAEMNGVDLRSDEVKTSG